MTHWFTADPHIGHKTAKGNIIELCNRPFRYIEEMDRVLFGFWQDLLRSGDTFYILGDIALNKPHAIRALDKIPRGVQVHYIFGNHDESHKKHIDRHKRVVWSGDLKSIKIQNQYIVLCHYSMRTWKNNHYGSWQLFGHSHGSIHPWDRQLDVGVDSAAKLVGEYRPMSFEEIARFIADGMNPKFLAQQFGKSPCWVGSG